MILIGLLLLGLRVQAQVDSLAVVRQAKQDIAILASESLAGRGYVADGHVKAALYLRTRFQALGLQSPALPEPYLHRFQFPLNLVRDARLTLGKTTLAVGRDFLPSPTTGMGYLTRTPVVDVGAGTVADYQRLAPKLAGNIILVREQPPSTLPDSVKRMVQDPQFHAQAAREVGARGVLLARQKLIHAFAPEADGVPILEVRAAALPKRVREASVLVDAVQGLQVSQNVVGIRPADVPGNDSLLVLCAHYDHLGRIGTTTFPGASDNASGTALLLAVAAQLRDVPLRHPVLFLAFGAEETGLNGSFAFVRAMPGVVDIRHIRQVLNFDIAGAGPDVMAVGAKTYPALYQTLQALNDSLRLLPAIQQRANAPNSDHWAFTQRGIPALFLYTLGGPGYYHDVDDKAETLPLTGFVNLSRLVASYVQQVAGVSSRP